MGCVRECEEAGISWPIEGDTAPEPPSSSALGSEWLLVAAPRFNGFIDRTQTVSPADPSALSLFRRRREGYRGLMGAGLTLTLRER